MPYGWEEGGWSTQRNSLEDAVTSPPYVAVSSGSSYYDNVRPLAYPDSDAVLICFDISRPETLDSVIKKVRAFLVCFDLKLLRGLSGWRLSLHQHLYGGSAACFFTPRQAESGSFLYLARVSADT